MDNDTRETETPAHTCVAQPGDSTPAYLLAERCAACAELASN